MPPIGKAGGVASRAGNEIAAHESRDRPAVVGRDGHLHPHPAFRYVPLPAHPGEREPLIHQRGVAELGGSRRIRRRGRLLEGRQDALGAAVSGFVEQSAVSAQRIDGLEQEEIGAELDASAPVARGQREIDNPPVLRQIRIQLEADDSDSFVRPGRPERLATEDDLSARDLQLDDVSGRRARGKDDCEQARQRGGGSCHESAILKRDRPRRASRGSIAA